MMRYSLLLIIAAITSACAKQPTASEMVSNFEEHKATFAMIASLACDIGAQKKSGQYRFNAKNDREEALLDLADTVDVDEIVYRAVEGNCQLTMPVWDSTNEPPESMAYRYNITEENNVYFEREKFEEAFTQLSQRKGSLKDAHLMMTKKWSFSVFRHAT